MLAYFEKSDKNWAFLLALANHHVVVLPTHFFRRQFLHLHLVDMVHVGINIPYMGFLWESHVSGILRGGFKYFLFSSLFGEDFQFDKYFSNGLKPPTSRFSLSMEKIRNFWWVKIVRSICNSPMNSPRNRSWRWTSWRNSRKAMVLASSSIEIIFPACKGCLRNGCKWLANGS